MKEHNGRLKAKKYKEYITGEELRHYVAKQLSSTTESIFDGAVGSGQLEQFTGITDIQGVEVQPEACEAFKENYPDAQVECMSFFNYKSDEQKDAVVMNPPFSLKFKELSGEERQNIKAEFPWKKSGVVDDIFILKGMKYTKRYGYFICYPGLAYRKTEKKMRELIGTQLKELHVIKNGFADTDIDVLFLIIDKEKTHPEYRTLIYDCKTQEKLMDDIIDMDNNDSWANDFTWEVPRIVEEPETIDIDFVNAEARRKDEQILDNRCALEYALYKDLGVYTASDLYGWYTRLIEIIEGYRVKVSKEMVW